MRGEYRVVEPPTRVVFSWGVPGNDVIPAGSSTVEITLAPDGDGTVVQLVHRDLPPDEVAKHGVGWEHFVRRLAGALTPR